MLVPRRGAASFNSLFYRSTTGARAGDTFMSLIHSAERNGVEPFEYLVELVKHPDAVKQDPAAWMPWNYPAPVASVGYPHPNLGALA